MIQTLARRTPDRAEIWSAFAATSPCLAIFDRHFQILRDDNGQRARIWAELTH